MAKINVKLEGKGNIDNAVIFLEDPQEKTAYYLNPKGNKTWEIDNLSVPIEGKLDYSLHVLAFSGTAFECIITNKDLEKTIKISGKTGIPIKNRARVIGSQEFS